METQQPFLPDPGEDVGKPGELGGGHWSNSEGKIPADPKKPGQPAGVKPPTVRDPRQPGYGEHKLDQATKDLGMSQIAKVRGHVADKQRQTED